MAPAHIRVMLDLYTMPSPGSLEMPIIVKQDLFDRGLIDSVQQEPKLTARGIAYVESLSYVPLPVAAYLTVWPKESRHEPIEDIE